MEIKAYEDLTIQDNFIFQKVMRNKRICKQTLERILDIEILDISYPEEEKSIDVRLDSKSIRLDIYVKDDKGTVFNIEMQTTKNMDDLLKRARYYQSLIDIDNIEKGQRYKNLNDTYIIFICTFKIFDGLRHKYTITKKCIEDYDILVNDGTNTVFLSTKGIMDDVSKPLRMFLDYVDGREPEDELLQAMDFEVNKIKRCEDWRRDYMTLELELNERLYEGINIGKAEGRAEGKAEGTVETLYSLLKKGLVQLDVAAKEANMTPDEFLAKAEMLDKNIK